MTLSDLISVFEGYAAQEDLIFHFEAREQMPNLSNEEEISTDAVMQVVISSLNPSFDTTQVNIDFYFLKRLDRDRTNYASVMSDTFLLCADFQQYMEVNIAPTQGVNISFTNSALPVNNFDLDYTAGVTLSASIVYANDGQCVVPPPPVCNPVTYEITDTDENVLYSGSVVSGGELNQTIQDSTAVLKDTDGNVISTTSILAEGSEDIVAPDAQVHIKKENDGTITNIFVPSGTTEVYVVNNNEISVNGNLEFEIHATDPLDIRLRDESNNEVTPVSVTHSGNHATIVLPDAPLCEGVDVFVGEANVGTFPSGSDVFVKVIQDGLEVIPEDVTVVDDEVSIILADTVPPTPRSTATLMKTGQTTSYRTGDDGDIEAGRLTNFLTLDSAPLHNNGTATINTTTNRFTDILGGQTYATDIVLDWSTWNGSTLLGYKKAISGVAVWNACIDNSLTFSAGTFSSGWRLANVREMSNIANYELAQVFNYAPFSHVGDHWTSTTSKSNTTFAFAFGGTIGDIYRLGKTGSAVYKPVRTFSLSTSNVLS